jgi:hypothetical protein
VTTIIGGFCGFSIAPMTQEAASYQSNDRPAGARYRQERDQVSDCLAIHR